MTSVRTLSSPEARPSARKAIVPLKGPKWRWAENNENSNAIRLTVEKQGSIKEEAYSGWLHYPEYACYGPKAYGVGLPSPSRRVVSRFISVSKIAFSVPTSFFDAS